ncbi:hypothetical protein HDV00_008621 [Rhizophlyctis rosea]|nr:hypothetical protein HDV00_008621 [Rhizophlyctis rosea]
MNNVASKVSSFFKFPIFRQPPNSATTPPSEYQIIIDYLTKVRDQYLLADKDLLTLNPFTLPPEVQTLLIAFANEQDKAYGGEQFTTLQPYNGHTDDIFELVFALRYRTHDFSNLAGLMHDAWTLSRTFYYNPDGVLVHHEETGELDKDGIPVLTERNYQTLISGSPKRLIRIVSSSGTLEDRHTINTVVQARRLKQFIEYATLQKEDSDKDEISVKAYKAIIAGREKDLAALFPLKVSL